MIDLGLTLTTATKILALVPKVAELINKSGDIYKILQNLKMDEDEMPPILVKLITNEQKRLEELIDKYYKIDGDKTAGAIDKKEAKIRVSAKICELLTGIDPIKNSIEGYQIIKELYCSSIPSSLNA